MKIGISQSIGNPVCDPQQTCQMAMNCFTDGLLTAICETLIGIAGLEAGAELWAGIVCGCLEGWLHYEVDDSCAKEHPCKKKEHNLLCEALSVASGCLNGLIGGKIKQWNMDIDELLAGIMKFLMKVGISGALDGGTDGACSKFGWD